MVGLLGSLRCCYCNGCDANSRPCGPRGARTDYSPRTNRYPIQFDCLVATTDDTAIYGPQRKNEQWAMRHGRSSTRLRHRRSSHDTLIGQQVVRVKYARIGSSDDTVYAVCRANVETKLQLPKHVFLWSATGDTTIHSNLHTAALVSPRGNCRALRLPRDQSYFGISRR
jgi:hypothetical protein